MFGPWHMLCESDCGLYVSRQTEHSEVLDYVGIAQGCECRSLITDVC